MFVEHDHHFNELYRQSLWQILKTAFTRIQASSDGLVGQLLIGFLREQAAAVCTIHAMPQ